MRIVSAACLWSLLAAVSFIGVGVLARPAAAQPCTGDCNHGGQVTIDEILTMVNLALHGGTGGCTAGDANGDGQITVDEILTAVNNALNACPSTPTPTPTVTAEDAVEMSAHGLLSSMHGVQATDQLGLIILDFGCVAAGGCSGTQSAGQVTRRSALEAAQSLCSDSGSVNTTCVADPSSSVETTVYTNCQKTVSGSTTVVNGTLTQTFETPTVCATGQVPDGVNFSINTAGFSKTVSDSGGSTTVQVVANMTQTFTTDGTMGCTGSNGTSVFNGTLSLLDTPSGTNATYGYENMQLVVESSIPGVPPCQQTTAATGKLRVDDHISGERFTMTLPPAPGVVITESDTQSSLATSGDVSIDCIGDVTACTLRAIEAPSGPSCSAVLHPTYVDAQGFFGPDGLIVGATPTVVISLGAGDIVGGFYLSLSSVGFDLDCKADSPPGLCNDDGDVISYLGDSSIVTTCPVTWSSNNPAGGSAPNHLVFTASPAITEIPTGSVDFCYLQFGVRIDSSHSNDSTPLVVESNAGLHATCDNGTSTDDVARLALSEQGGGSCEPLIGLLYPGGTGGPLVGVDLSLGNGRSGSTNFSPAEVSFDLDTDAASLFACGAAIKYLGDSSIWTTCPVTWSSNNPAGGSIPNHLVFTGSLPWSIPRDTDVFCDLHFDVQVASIGGGSIPFPIEQQAEVIGGCDNGLREIAIAGGSIVGPGSALSSVMRTQAGVVRSPSGGAAKRPAAASVPQDCPLGGLVALAPPGAEGHVQFMVDGSVQLDFGNGNVKVLNSCKDLQVARCSNLTPTRTPGP